MKKVFVLLSLSAWLFLTLLHCGPPKITPDGGTAEQPPPKSCDWSKCPEGEYCDHEKGCRKKCDSDKDCSSAKQLCHKSRSRCVDCLRNSDCGVGSECRQYRCFKIVTCRSSKDCEGDTVCDTSVKQCVQCQASGDCEAKQTCKDGVCIPTPPLCVSDKDCKLYGLVCDLKTSKCVECKGDNDCEIDRHCRANSCIENLCQKGTKRCAKDSEAVEECKADNSGWSAPQTCGANEFCTEGTCKEQACTPGEQRCEKNSVIACDPRGVGFLKPIPCAAGQFCDEGGCKLQDCKPNEIRCRNELQETCRADGSRWEQKACSTTEYCGEGKCQTKICEPGQGQCNKNTVQSCKADGSGWEDKNDCGASASCDKGACIPNNCNPGETICAGDTVKKCKADGQSWDDTPCKATEYCTQGRCQAKQCTPNTRQCKDDTTAQRCRPDGSSWEDSLCAPGERCDAGSCLKQVCTPNATTCQDTQSLKICGAKGVKFTTQKCPAGEYCEKGVCNTQTCKPGTRECPSANTARTCNASGSGWNVTNCVQGQGCQGGQCVVLTCTPNAKRCADATTAEACDAIGLKWTRTSCGTQMYCDQGQCKQGSCTEGATQACYTGAAATRNKGLCSDGTQTCTKGAWTTCAGERTPGTEVCDRLDNNCNGQTDEGSQCPKDPTITSVTPSGWNNLCDADVEVIGTNFTTSTTLVIASQLYLPNPKDSRYKLTYVSATKLTFRLNATGLTRTTHDLFVENAPGFVSPTVSFQIKLGNATPPKITRVLPASAAADSKATVQISGSTFYPGSIVYFNGKAQTTTCQQSSCNQLNATLDLTGLQPGTATLSVSNPCGVKSDNFSFVINPPPKPSIHSVTPSFVRVGDTTNLVIKGENFTPTHELLWKGTKLASTFVSATEISTASAIDLTQATPGSATVQVDNKNGTKSNIVSLTILPKNQTLAIASLSVTLFEAGKFYPQVIVTGQGFTSNTTITFNNVLQQITYNSPTQITIPLLDLTQTAAGTYELFAKEGTTESNRVSIVAQATGGSGGVIGYYISPGSGVAGNNFGLLIYVENYCPASGTRCTVNPTITITDQSQRDFSSNIVVTSTYTLPGSSYIKANLTGTSMPPGTYHFVINHPSGGKSNPLPFSLTVPPPPTVTSITPRYAVVNSSKTLFINGTNFVNGATVYIGPLALAASYSSSRLQVTVDGTKFSAGSYTLYVRNPDAQRSQDMTFSVVSATAPSITTFATGGFFKDWNYPSEIIYGVNWQSNPTFSIDGGPAIAGTSCRIFSGLRDSYCYIRPLSTLGLSVGPHTIRYQQGSTQSIAYNFQIKAGPKPELHTLSPTELGPDSPSGRLTLSGKNFASGAVLVLGTYRIPLTYSNSSSLNVTLSFSSYLPGTYQAYIENPDKQKSNAMTLTLLPNLPPLIFRTNPNIGDPTNSKNFNIYGAYFQTGMTLTINGSTVAYTYRSPTQLEMRNYRFPTTASDYKIQLTKPNGLKSQVHAIEQTDTSLFVHRVSHSSTIRPNTSYTLYVYGRGFTNQSKVLIDLQSATTYYNNSTTLRVVWRSPNISTTTDYNVVVTDAGKTSNVTKFSVVPTSTSPWLAGALPSKQLQGTGFFAPNEAYVSGRSFTNTDQIFFRGSPLKTTFTNTARLSINEPFSTRSLPLGLHFYHLQSGSQRSNVYPLAVQTQRQRGIALYYTLSPDWVHKDTQLFMQIKVMGLQASDVTAYEVIIESASLATPVTLPLRYPWGIHLDSTGWNPGLYTVTLRNKTTSEKSPNAAFAVIK